MAATDDYGRLILRKPKYLNVQDGISLGGWKLIY
jgi:hypothetical protein